jgi:DNA-binding CsgD family transcriptional regulator
MQVKQSISNHYSRNSSYVQIHTEKDWLNFKQRFESDHFGYTRRLQQQHPTLQESEMRLLMMTELNMNEQNIAESLGVSLDFIKRELFSLCKKLRVHCSELKDIAHSI